MITHKTKVIFVLTLAYFIVASVGLGWVGYEVNQVGNELENYVTVIANKSAQEQKYAELSDLVEKTEIERKTLEKYVLTEEKTITFLSEIEKIGVEQGVTLITNSLKVVENPDTYNQLTVNFSVEGDEKLVFRMMQILESVPYHSEISTLVLTLDTEEGLTTMNIELSVSLFST